MNSALSGSAIRAVAVLAVMAAAALAVPAGSHARVGDNHGGQDDAGKLDYNECLAIQDIYDYELKRSKKLGREYKWATSLVQKRNLFREIAALVETIAGLFGEWAEKCPHFGQMEKLYCQLDKGGIHQQGGGQTALSSNRPGSRRDRIGGTAQAGWSTL